jgi:hypothetical protein
MSEGSKNTVATAGKEKKKTLTKSDIKGMSKYQAQKILNERDPEMLNKIEKEVAEKAASLKKKIMFVGFIIMAAAVSFIIYNEMQK